MPRGFSDLYGCLLCPPASLEEMEVASRAVEIAAQHGMRGADIRIGAILALRLREEQLADMNAVGPEAPK